LDHVFPPPPVVAVPVAGGGRAYPIRRFFCVGRNYAAHAAEMGGEVDREAPWYFMKSADAYLASGATLPYPPGTADFHHEIELYLALGAPLFNATAQDAPAAVWGYGTALDMTRRDLQREAKEQRRPWDLAKNIEGGAVLSPLLPATEAGALGDRRIRLSVNGTLRQEARLDEMVWPVADILAHLSRYYHLGPGDVVLTGTPSGVGAVRPGDVLDGGIDGLPPLRLTIGPPEAGA
jgi:fumarylpyruvate hydrolase